MAERIKSYESRIGRPPVYPWAEWMDGSAWRIKRGEDFEIEPALMAQAIRVHGRRNGVPASATVDGDAIEFQFSPQESEAA